MKVTTVTVLAFCGWVASGPFASAQTFTLQSPGGAASAHTVPAAADWSSVSVGDPWDFQERSDYVYMYSNGFPTQGIGQTFEGIPTVSGGLFQGRVSSVPNRSHPGLQLQFEGIAGALNLLGRNGITYPIDANLYKRVSFRLRRTPETQDALDTFDVTWITGTQRLPEYIGAKLALTRGFDPHNRRYNNQSPVATQTSATFHIYKLDLDTPAGPLKFGVEWKDIVRGILLRLGEGDLAPKTLTGSLLELDWVRLTPRGTSTINLNWSGFSGPVTLTATNGTDIVQIYPDDGTNATTFPATAAFTWDYGYLPPGIWTVTAAAGGASRVVTLTLLANPIIHLTKPDASGGRDFATTVIGDTWDLKNAADTQRFGGVFDVKNVVYAEDGLTASTTSNNPAIVVADDTFYQPPRRLAIDADTYKHLTFTVDFDRKELDGHSALTDDFGGIARAIWRRSGAPATTWLTNTLGIFVLDAGPQTFSMDLSEFTKFGTGADSTAHLEATQGQDLWRGSIGVLRFDPYENNVERSFRMVNVKLAADDEPNGNGFFIVKWTAGEGVFQAPADAAGDPHALTGATVKLYYDTDRDPNNGRTLLAQNVSALAGQYAWHLAGVPAGRYFIQIEITSTGGTQSRYSTGPLRVASTVPPLSDSNSNGLGDPWETQYQVTDPNGDPDGDGVSNLDEFRRATDPAISNVWTLPEGATGFFEERIALANPTNEVADVDLTFLRETGAPVVRQYTVLPKSRQTVIVNDVTGLSSAAVSTLVNTTRGGIVAERTMIWDNKSGDKYGGHTGKAIQAARQTWYLAEGDARSFDTYILVANANPTAASVAMTFLLEDATTIVKTYSVNANARLTVYANDVWSDAGRPLRGNSFSTVVQSSIPTTVERAMYLSPAGGKFWEAGHESAAVEAPATNWFVAEGRTGPFFDTYLLLANPGATQSVATIRYLRPGASVVTQTLTLAPTSRSTIHVDSVAGLADTDVSASITATSPIIVERAMYWPDPFTGWYEAHNSAGVTQTGTRWALAEGEFGGSLGASTFLLLANPNATDAMVTVTVLRTGASPTTTTMVVPANSRLTRDSAEAAFGLSPGERFGFLVESTNNVPIVVERAMYWSAGGKFWAGGTNETAVRLK